MKRHLASAAVAGTICLAAGVANAAAVDATWIGGSSGAWKDDANWDAGEATGYPAGADSVAHFTNTVTVTSDGVNFCEIYVADNCTVTHNATSTSFTKGNANNEVVIDVGKNATFKQAGSNPNIYGGNVLTLVKKGEGTLIFGGAVGHWSQTTYVYKTVDVRGGVLRMGCNQGPRLFSLDNRIRIHSGAKVVDARGLAAQQFQSSIVFEIDEGGTLDYNNNDGTQRGIIGAGAAINMGSVSSPVTLRGEGVAIGSQGVFTGTISGYVNFAPTNGLPFVIGAADTLSNAIVTTQEPETGKALAFASGIGKYQIKNETVLPALSGYTTDAAGDPIVWRIAKTADYTHSAAGDDDWSNVELVAKGNVTEKSGGTWTIGSITMPAGKTFTVSEDAGGDEIHFGGGTMTGIIYAVSKPGYSTYFDGVDFYANNQILGSLDRTYYQTGGSVYLTKLNCMQSFGNPVAMQKIYYYISGGTLTSVPGYYQFGLGLEASGDAQVYLRDGTYSGNTIPHSLSVSTNGYVLRVCGNAQVHADSLNYYYGSGGACTAGVEIAENGLLEVGGAFGSYSSTTPNANFHGYFQMDGGTFRSTFNKSSVIFPNTTPNSFVVGLGAGGAVIDVLRTNDTFSLSFRYDVTNCADGVSDGGFTKTGFGTLEFQKDCYISGPVNAVNGRIRALGVGNGGNALGTGPVRLGRAMISMKASGAQKLASGPGATVTMTAPGMIRKLVSGAPALEIGPAGAVSTPLRRENHAIMVIGCGLSAPSDSIPSFDTYPVKINGGIGDMPVFAWERTIDYSNAGKNVGERTAKFVVCDAEGNLSTREPDYLNALPDGGDASAFVRIARNQTVFITENNHVGCLDIYGGNYHSTDKKNQVGGISIADGVTLTVGQGAGTIAKVLLNNNYRGSGILEFGEATVAGEGTLDFGAAEGLFVVNDAFDLEDLRRPARLFCKIAGTGGVTFASPYTVDGNATGDNIGRVRAVRVTGRNTYSGGTWIDGLAVAPGNCDALGSGAVSVQGDNITGGEIIFLPEYTGEDFTNALTIAGQGQYFTPARTNRWGGKAAVVAMHDVALAGGVALAADSSMFVLTNMTLTLASPVTGTGRLTVKGGGTLAIAAPITCSDGVEYDVDAVEVRPARAGTLPLAAADIPDGATLVIEGSGSPDGCGTLVVDGDLDLSRIGVRFGPRSSFSGTTFTVLRATGTISGELDASTLPGANWHYEYSSDEVIAVREIKGTAIMLL